ncbi:NnrU family protein [uncultured Algimonas sp.]|uniref:NnrU family protein n=1 Tax=uncultured Algimonas sp. TaxID=1547920 RepID=UPI0026075AB5|nr:NnrU family protein [uncultured Algimonas sp.]
MTLFLTGLAGFFGTHFFSALRSREPGHDLRQRLGEARYMGVYSIVSLAFFGLMLAGYGRAPDGSPLWTGPEAARTLSWLPNGLALILLIAAYAPTGRIKRTVHHPMMIGTGLWAFAHLAVGGDLSKMLLFGAFALYSVVSVTAAFARGDRVMARPRVAGDLIAVALGIAATLGLWYGGHAAMFGVAPE